ncbi:hypothetical protein LIER_42047 [Lithospermum erythrorhizon]|uniref:Uncharacterized protein n=1 Tax=Lithospermum erythrorhizon TaxID=34254 RepID=A0AAV3RIM6_LITER
MQSKQGRPSKVGSGGGGEGGEAQGKFLSKVSWNNINDSKKEGGLGVKGLMIWNRACMALHMWDICSLKESLWVEWIVTYKLKGKSFWGLKMKSSDSWSWRKLINNSKDVANQ